MMRTRLKQIVDEKQSLPLLIKHLLDVAARQENEEQIFYGDQQCFSYKHFYERICQLANMLRKAGLRPGDAVAILDYNSSRQLECLFAVPMCGAVIHLVNTSLPAGQISKIMNKNEDKLVILHPDFVPLMEGMAGKLESVQEFIIAADGGPVPENALDAYGEYETLLESEEPRFHFPDFSDKSIAVATYRFEKQEAKALLLTHKEIVSQSLAYTASMQEKDEYLHFKDTYMPLAPFYEQISTFEPYIATLMAIKQVYPGKCDVEEVRKIVQAQGVTFSRANGQILKELFEREETVPSEIFKNWRIVVRTGRLSDKLKKQITKKGVKLYEQNPGKERIKK